MDRRTLLKSLAATPALVVPAKALECDHDFVPMMKSEQYCDRNGGFGRTVIAWEHPFRCSKCGVEKLMNPYSHVPSANS